MKKKVILISIDGMRPDGLKQYGNPCVEELEKICSYTYNAKSLYPPVTLPCHFSMTHSVTPQRHGILTNTYIPQVRPVKGIFEVISQNRGDCAMFYGWEPLRDVSSPDSLKFSTYINAYKEEHCDINLTDEAEKLIDTHHPDFVFLYMVETDEKGGHDSGFMSDEYLRRVSIAIENSKRIIDKFGDEYSVIITADHGGHDRSHGLDIPEDMIIPMFFYGPKFKPGEIKKEISLLDIAPTIAGLMKLPCEPEWEGKKIF